MKIASSLLTPAVIILVNLGIAAVPIANADSDDDVFLQVLDDKGISFPNLTEAGVVSLGKGVCQDWSQGATFSEVISDVQSTTQLSAGGTGTFIGAATASFCPRYVSKIPSE
jgi:Protein of unknown function (DUF732)